MFFWMSLHNTGPWILPMPQHIQLIKIIFTVTIRSNFVWSCFKVTSFTAQKTGWVAFAGKKVFGHLAKYSCVFFTLWFQISVQHLAINVYILWLRSCDTNMLIQGYMQENKVKVKTVRLWRTKYFNVNEL